MDDDTTVKTTSQNDDENTDMRYAKSLYDDSETKDDLTEDSLNSENDDLGAGLGDDAYQTYDSDDATLPAENDDDVTETGIEVEDADNLLPSQENLGDVIIDPDAGDTEDLSNE